MIKTLRSHPIQSTGVVLILVLTLSGFACPVSAKSAAVAVNRYAESLSHLQDAEITAHDQKLVSDDHHTRILKAEKIAAKEGQNLDTAIGIAAAGGDITKYVDAANKAYNDLVTELAPTNQNLVTLGQAAGDVLKNAISLIQQLKANAGTPATPATPAPAKTPTGMLIFMFLGTLGMAAIGVGSAIQLLQVIVALEPIAFDLVMKLAVSLKGKTIEEVLAMNEQLFGKVQATVDAELDKMGSGSQPPTQAPAKR